MNVGYYVTVIRGKRVGYLSGPHAAHDDALAMVEPTRKRACEIDPWCDFDLFGTTKIETPRPLPKGVLS